MVQRYKTPDGIEDRRDHLYRRLPARRIRTIRAAARFIDSVGFCLLFASTQGIELPSLFEAIKGRRHMHIEDWDADADRLWAWKNDLPAERRAYYGKVLAAGKPVLVSLDMLPSLYALVAPQNVRADYARGRLSYEAKRVYDALQGLGPTPTMALRAAAGLDRSSDSGRYHHALDELQRACVIAPVGATIETGAWASQIFELVERWFAPQVARAHAVEVKTARQTLVKRYLQTVLAAQPPMVARVFGWPRDQVNETLDDLIRRRELVEKEGWVFHGRRRE